MQLHVDHEGNNTCRADSDPSRIRANAARLHPAGHAGETLGNRASAIYQAIDNTDVYHSPENGTRAVDNGIDDRGVVSLIHPVFVEQRAIRTFEADGYAVWYFRTAHIEQVRHPKAE